MSKALLPYIERIIELIVSPLVYLMFLVAFVVFVWGIFIMILNAADESKRSEGKKHMMYGIIGMLVMFGANGIFEILKATILSAAG